MPGSVDILDLSFDSDARRAFARLAEGPDAAIDLAEGALLIDAEEREDEPLDAGAYLEEIDVLATRVRHSVSPGADVPERLMALHRVLFEEAGFGGDNEDYYALENALFSRMMDRRRGLPILLSVLYVEVARRSGVDASGVGFPGHFLVRAPVHDGFVVIDPFFGGRILDLDACEQLLTEIVGEQAEFDLSYLDPATPREVLIRILANLRQMYLRDEDLPRALRAQDRIVLLDPDSPPSLHDRARLYTKLGAWPAAVSDLERIVQIAPTTPEADLARHALARLRTQVRHLN